jgi:hypothetical protein
MKREGAGAGCGWMRRLHEWIPADLSDDAARRRQRFFLGWLWAATILAMLAVTLVDGVVRRSRLRAPGGTYVSEARIGGLPLVAIGRAPRAIVAIGEFPVGLLALGSIPVGGVAIGGLAVGGIALGGLSLGLFAIGGMAAGVWALGGGAFGRYALGGLAVGDHAYAGNGIAIGRREACGRQKERLVG